MAKKENVKVEIPAMNIQYCKVRVVGDSPFICHAWSEKARKEMWNKQQKKATAGKEIRYPHIEFVDCLYWFTEKPNLKNLTDEQAQEVLAEVIPQSKFGFPSAAFKAAAIVGAFQQGALAQRAGGADLAKTTARGAFFVINEFSEIEGTPTLREDMARIPRGGSQIVFRAEFKKWAATLNIKYNANAISLEQIVNLLNIGGFSNGIGDWRPEKNGTFGTFHVE